VRIYLTTLEVLLMQELLIKRYGGLSGVRDLGAVEAAVFRPQSGYYDDIAEEAAALLESLLINHPFIDGNKRIAFAACDTFLRVNNHKLQATPVEMLDYMQDWIAAKENRYDAITSILREIII